MFRKDVGPKRQSNLGGLVMLNECQRSVGKGELMRQDKPGFPPGRSGATIQNNNMQRLRKLKGDTREIEERRHQKQEVEVIR